ncbi:hypothetical protein ACFLZN_01240 [Nanoarchaeota archaeon]
MDNKGQVEIMGLLLIILLFSIGVLFALSWILDSGGDNEVQREKDEMMARNTLTTLRKITTDCFDNNIESLLQDCTQTGGTLRCSGRSSCQYSEFAIKEILELAFENIKRDYVFWIEGNPHYDGKKFSNFPAQECPRNIVHKNDKIPVGIGRNIVLKLDICS